MFWIFRMVSALLQIDFGHFQDGAPLLINYYLVGLPQLFSCICYPKKMGTGRRVSIISLLQLILAAISFLSLYIPFS